MTGAERKAATAWNRMIRAAAAFSLTRREPSGYHRAVPGGRPMSDAPTRSASPDGTPTADPPPT